MSTPWETKGNTWYFLLYGCDQSILGDTAIVIMQQTHLILMVFWYKSGYKSECELSRVLAPCCSLCGLPDTDWQSQTEGAHSHRVGQLVSGVWVGQWRFYKMTKKHVHFYLIIFSLFFFGHHTGTFNQQLAAFFLLILCDFFSGF